MQNLCRKCDTITGTEQFGKKQAIYLDLLWKPHHQYDNAHKWLSIGVYLPGGEHRYWQKPHRMRMSSPPSRPPLPFYPLPVLLCCRQDETILPWTVGREQGSPNSSHPCPGSPEHKVTALQHRIDCSQSRNGWFTTTAKSTEASTTSMTSKAVGYVLFSSTTQEKLLQFSRNQPLPLGRSCLLLLEPWSHPLPPLSLFLCSYNISKLIQTDAFPKHTVWNYTRI